MEGCGECCGEVRREAAGDSNGARGESVRAGDSVRELSVEGVDVPVVDEDSVMVRESITGDD